MVTAVPVGTAVSFPNRDTVRHHVYSFSPAKTFELKLYIGTPAAPVVFDKPGVVVMGCNIHDAMVAYVAVFDAPWVGVSDAAGVVRIDALPAGDYQLEYWASALGRRRRRTRADAASPARRRAADPGDRSTALMRGGPGVRIRPGFRKLQWRIAAWTALILLSVQIGGLFLFERIGRSSALGEVRAQLATGDRVFARLLEQRGDQLAQAARVLAADYGFRAALQSADRDTVASALENHGSRIGARQMLFMGLDGRLDRGPSRRVRRCRRGAVRPGRARSRARQRHRLPRHGADPVRARRLPGDGAGAGGLGGGGLRGR